MPTSLAAKPLFLALAALTLSYGNPALAEAPAVKYQEMAILGDSGATGVMADPGVFLSLTVLGNLATPRNRIESNYGSVYRALSIPYPLSGELPRRYLPAPKDRGQKLALNFELNTDRTFMSWGYLTGRVLGVQGENMHFFARNGRRSEHLLDQIKQLKKTFAGQLPELTVISLTANDFCSEAVFTDKGREDAIRKHERNIMRALNQLRSLPTRHASAKIVFMAPLPVTKILRSQALAEKRTLLAMDIFTCGEIRSTAHSTIPGKDLAESLRRMCPAVMRTAPDDEARIEKLESLFADVVKTQKEILTDFAIGAPAGKEFLYFQDSFELDLRAKDVANDCFHPSIYGHGKIAARLIDFLRK
ncbi:MAG TPA: SGNH/GDSL hydrolase family protein [Bdellovibrionota bacterium]|nr:SGNH/GDSL hydrolase family protein [Bdellovibrionota bacterium]